jgi:putative variant cofactor biosynthesis B12-binding/radical SAM domain protein 1
MRVLMIQTPSVEGPASERVYPIGIVTLASRLIGVGHEVAVLDMNIELDAYGALQEKLLCFQPEAVCLSLRNIDPLANKTSSLIPPFVVTVRLIKAVLPQAKLIVGGTGFSLFPERILLELPEINYGIVGEAETSLPALLNSLDNPPQIKGLCWRAGDRVRVRPPAAEFAMTSYVPPNRDIMNPSQYLDINTYVPAIGIETKRGCPFSCAYCVYPKLQGKELRCRHPKDVVDELEFLQGEYGMERFHFTDPVVNIPRGHLEEICQELLKRKLTVWWSGFFREDYLTAANVALFARAGCECFSFSPDGLHQEALDVLDKNLQEADILKAAQLTAATDVVTVYHFMVNVPGETGETAAKGIAMMEKLYAIHSNSKNLGAIVLNNIRILPGTPIEALAREQGVIDANTDLLYPVYYNPEPFQSFRYRLETLNLCQNVFMWKGVQ